MDIVTRTMRTQKAGTTSQECYSRLADLSTDLHFAAASFLNAKDLSAFVLAAPWLTRSAFAEQCLGALFLELTRFAWARRGDVSPEVISHGMPGCELEASLRHRTAFGLDLKDIAGAATPPPPPPHAGRAAEALIPARADSRLIPFTEEAAKAMRVSCQRAYALLPPYWPRGFDQSQLSPSPRHRIDLLDDQGNRVDTLLNSATERASSRAAAPLDNQETSADESVERIASGSSSTEISSSSACGEAATPPPPRTAVYRGRNPGGDRCVVAEAPFPPLITLPWTIVRYAEASEPAQGGGESCAGSTSSAGAGSGICHQARSSRGGSSSGASGSSGVSSSNRGYRDAHVGSKKNENAEGAVCLSFCAYYEVDILLPPREPTSSLSSSSSASTEVEFESPTVSIGLCKEVFPTAGKQPGWDRHSWGYHGDDGRYYHGSGLSGRVAGNGLSGVATFGAGDTVGVGAILLPDPAYPAIALFFTLNGSPLGPEGGEPLSQPWAEYESRLGVSFAFLLDPRISQEPLRPVLGLDSPCPVRLRLGDSPQNAFKLPFAALARVDAVCSGHCLAGFPLAPYLPCNDHLFTRTIPRPMPGQASALLKPPSQHPVRPDKAAHRRHSSSRFLWRPFGTLLDPPGMPAEMPAEATGSKHGVAPAGWGWAKMEHVAAFAAAPGARQPGKRSSRVGARLQNGDGSEEEDEYSDGMKESSLEDADIIDLGSSEGSTRDSEDPGTEEESEEGDSEEEDSDEVDGNGDNANS